MDRILWKGGTKESLSERTLVFLKPEAVMRGFIGEIVTRIEKKGLTITAIKLTQLTLMKAKKIYEMHRDKPFYESLIKHITSGPVLAMVIEGPKAISVLRNMIGKTNPHEAHPGTVRGDLALNTQKNIIHAADNSENANREIKIFFNSDDIVQYSKPTEAQYLF